MYLIYLDESGTPFQRDTDPYFSLGGIVVCERDWKLIDNEVETIKKKFNLTEIHMRKLYNKNKKAIHHSNKSRPAQIINEVYDAISRSALTLFCMSINKTKEFRITEKPEIEYLAWDLLVERLNISIDKMCKECNMDEFGLIIMDETNRSKDLRIRNYLRELRETGTQYQKLERLIEDPIFTPSHWRNLTQLADAVVCCSKFHIRQEEFFNTQFEKMKDKFSKNSYGSINNAGFKIW